jgi:hypothetical protein
MGTLEICPVVGKEQILEFGIPAHCSRSKHIVQKAFSGMSAVFSVLTAF